jgi:predicted ATPase
MRAEEQPLWLSRLLPARGGAGEGAAGARERYLAFETVRGLLEQTAERWPLLLVLDDVHWADEDSLALLRHLARSALRARMLIVLCVRDTELGDAAAGVLGDLRREGPLVHVALGGLDDEAIAAVIARTARRADIDTARRYRERTGGNPLFLDELLRDERERPTAATTPPAGVLDVIARRLARLDEATRDTLELAALIGLEFDVGTLAAAGAGAAVGEPRSCSTPSDAPSERS